MIGKLFKLIIFIAVLALISAAASIAGVYYDDRQQKIAKEEEKLAQEELAKQPKEVSSPYDKYQSGVLELKMDYDAQLSGDDLVVSVLTNLPDSYNLTAELSNTLSVKKQLGLENVSASALTADQMREINEKSYSRTEKNFVTNGVCKFLFKAPPSGQMELKVTSPITKLQPATIQEMMGEKGANLQGNYVVYLEEMADKFINFSASFIIEDEEAPQEQPVG